MACHLPRSFIWYVISLLTSLTGAVALAEYIADSYTISQLDLRENDIKTAGLLAVSMCLRVHQTVTRLEIDQNVKKENVSFHFRAF